MLVVEPCLLEGGIIIADTDTDNWTHIYDEDVDAFIQEIKDKRDYYKEDTV